MRILLIHNLPPWDARAGGGQRVQHEVAAHATAAGHDVTAIHLGSGAGAPTTPYRTVWVRERRRLIANAVAIARAARHLARDWRPDVVHASAGDAGLVPLVLPDGVGLVATSHHPDPPRLPPTLPILSPSTPGTLRRLQQPLLEANLLRSAHRIVAVSQWGADVLRERGYLPASRPVAVVPNGVASEWFAPIVPGETATARAPAFFLAVGRVEPAKGWDVLLAAVGHPGAPAGARLAFAGVGPDLHALNEQVREAGLIERVSALGKLDPEALRARLSGATALVLASRQENYPLVLLEAMAAGVPVVATRVGGIGEMIEDGVSGLLVPSEDPAELAGALARVASDGQLRARLVAGGRAAAERHRWPRVVERLLAEYALARELARPVPRPSSSPASSSYRRAAAWTAARGAPRADASAPPRAAERITVVRPGRLGDLLLADPLVAALQDRHPGARIELVTDDADRLPPWMASERVAQRTLTLRRGPDAWRRPRDEGRARSLAALARDWSVAPPDLLIFAIDLADPVLRALAAELIARAPRAWRAGLVPAGTRAPELHAAVDPGREEAHEIERLLALAAAAGCYARFRLPRVPRARSPLAAWDGPTLVVHPGASRPTKQWPLERWGELAARLGPEGFRTVVVGAPEDRAHVPSLGIAFDDRALVDRVGTLDLAGLAAAVAGAQAFVGNDSFPFHLAVASEIPSIALVGPGAARWTRYPVAHAAVLREPVVCSPRSGEECPVYTTCPHGACMRSIRLETVAEAVLSAAGAGSF